MHKDIAIYLDTTVISLYEKGVIDKTVLRACEAAKPPMETAGDIAAHLDANGSFARVPGCRRPGRIPDTLSAIAEKVKKTPTPSDEKPERRQRNRAMRLSQDASFVFLTDEQRENVLAFRKEHGYLPMFMVLRYYLTRPDASRNDIIMSYGWGLNPSADDSATLASIGEQVGLSRERIRQILLTYEIPDELSHQQFWNQYVNHSTFYVDAGHSEFENVRQREIPNLTFAAYADILHRTTMMFNVNDRFMARRGWIKEISAWVDRFDRLSEMTRSIDSRVSLEGLAMGGNLDTRIALVVLNQLAPAYGFIPDPPGHLILPRSAD